MTISINLIGRYASDNGSEIPAFDALTQRLFIVAGDVVEIINLANTATPDKIGDLAFNTDGVANGFELVPNSVAVGKEGTVSEGIVAVALAIVEPTRGNQARGEVQFFNASTGAFLGKETVGFLPDMVTFSPDGTRVLTANEGEPNENYTFDPVGSVSVINLLDGVSNATVRNASFTSFNNQIDELRASGVRIFGPNATVAKDVEPEYIAFSGDGSKAWVTLQENNAIAIVDIATATVESIKPLGFKNHRLSGNGIDPSDRDDTINIRNVPVLGMYQPDAIASYTVNGMTYYVTANEGDSRVRPTGDDIFPDVEEGDIYNEEIRLGDDDYILDPVAFPNAEALKRDANLGRLTVTNTLGDTDGDGDFDKIYAFGSRSFSIWDSNGNLVYDSGDDFEQTTALAFPENFNASNSNNDFDNRSDNKGPEPEGVTIGVIKGQTYAFVGLERIGGVMVYNVTDPVAPEFVEYINTRDFNEDPETNLTDSGPEGLTFVNAQDSPNGKPLLIVSNEVSNTTNIFEIEVPPTNFTLQLLHASDQEAGISALQDAIGFSAVMNALDAQYENTLKLSSGDLFIAGPFFNASTDIYGQQGIADILIQNELGWDAAAVGNHEFDAGTSAFYNAIASNPDIQGVGIDSNIGYQGASFPYLATNLDYSTDSSKLKDLVVPSGESPLPNSLTESVIIDVNGEQVGVIAAVVPYLPQIANIGDITMLTNPNSRDIEVNAQLLAANIQPFVDELVNQGINKIVLMTHLQQFEIEQALAPKLRNVDILMGGGSHRVMANTDDPRRQDETQTPPELLEPYPQVFQDADGNDIYLINTGANYRYLGQLIVEFDPEGKIITIGDDSGTFATDIAGVDRLYEENITTFEQVKAVADAELVEIVDGVGDFINSEDENIFGNTEVYLNGLRSSVRSEETNLGNLTADANLWYAQQYGLEVDISIKNGGGIRDQIGVSFIDGGTNDLIQWPPQANPAVGKEEGDISQLDIANSLRFDNQLAVADISAEGIKDLAEHFVAQWAEGATPGQFGQIGGFSFSFDPDNTPIQFTRNSDGDATGVTIKGDRIQNLVLNREDGSKEVIFADGEFQVDVNTTYKMVILDFLAEGGDGYPTFYFENKVTLSDLTSGNIPDNALGLEKAGEQDALAEYLAEFYPNANQPFNEADTPISEDTRIQNLNFRDDTVLEGVNNPENVLTDSIFRFRTGNNTYLYVGEEERQSILQSNFGFVDEGKAFKVSLEADDELIPIYRFRNQDVAGAYLYVGEEERQSVLNNNSNLIEEGLAFYTYGANEQQADDIYRFQTISGAYLYVGEQERQTITQGRFNFTEEGTAFEAIL
jgi:2',3'-cyclic-nucleotide 2'-phosphodiesterase / 3'-nucleotidase / 5'-nucleotidase